jgi:hypothetical protein
MDEQETGSRLQTAKWVILYVAFYGTLMLIEKAADRVRSVIGRCSRSP